MKDSKIIKERANMKKSTRNKIVLGAAALVAVGMAVKKLAADPELREKAKENGKKLCDDAVEFGKSAKDVAQNTYDKVAVLAEEKLEKVKAEAEQLKEEIKAEVDRQAAEEDTTADLSGEGAKVDFTDESEVKAEEAEADEPEADEATDADLGLDASDDDEETKENLQKAVESETFLDEDDTDLDDFDDSVEIPEDDEVTEETDTEDIEDGAEE